MKARVSGVCGFFLMGTLVFASACSSTRGKQVVSIERMDSKGNYISKAYAYKKNGEVTITGKVKRKNTISSFGHVDISIILPDGKILKEISTSYTPKIIKRKGAKQSSFTATLPVNPPEGSKVVVGYHSDSSDLSNSLICSQNIASGTMNIASAALPATHPEIDLVDKGIVSLELLPSKGNYISKANVKKLAGSLVVSGTLKRRNAGSSFGHVDIGIISPEGKMLKEVTTSYTPGIIKRVGSKESYFSANIPIAPPTGSKIVIGYHPDSSKQNKYFTCSKNVTSRVKIKSSAALPVFLPKIDLVGKGIVSLELLPSKGNFVSKAFAYKDKGMLVISGKIKRKSSWTSFGHVDIGVISPDGEILKEVSTSYVPGIIRRKGSKESSFNAYIPIIPPTGSTIRIGYHLE